LIAPSGPNIGRKKIIISSRAVGTEPKRNVLALMQLQFLRTDGMLFVYDLFFPPNFSPKGAIKKLRLLNLMT
jgi:hypothetical protein